MKHLIAGSLFAFGLIIAAPAGAAPFMPSSQVIVGQSETVAIPVRGGHGWGRGHGNRGLHLGWTRGRHRGWAHSHHRRH